MKKMKPLFEKPLGPPVPTSFISEVWHTGTTNAVTCEICGTEHPENPDELGDDLHLGKFLGRQVVAECCGRIFDIAFEELGEKFARAFVMKVGENPASHGAFLYFLKEHLEKVKMNLREVAEIVEQTSESTAEIIG